MGNEVIEVVGIQDVGSKLEVAKPKGMYHHCNT